MADTRVSSCCGSLLNVAGHTTRWYACSSCGKPCDAVPGRDSSSEEEPGDEEAEADADHLGVPERILPRLLRQGLRLHLPQVEEQQRGGPVSGEDPRPSGPEASRDPWPFEPDWTLSPGTLLYEILKDRCITPGGLTLLAVLPEETVRGVLRAEIPVTQDIAAGLETALGTPASFWLNAERVYRGALAQGKSDSSWGGRDL